MCRGVHSCRYTRWAVLSVRVANSLLADYENIGVCYNICVALFYVIEVRNLMVMHLLETVDGFVNGLKTSFPQIAAHL